MEEAKKSKSGFFAGVKKEFGRVTWPTRKETFKQTVAVLLLSVMLGVMISGLDAGFSTIVLSLTSNRQAQTTEVQEQTGEETEEGEEDAAAEDSEEEDTGETD
ncbi:MAG: preprotein translocase subunit SecE [Lachnospiraceae bacterium]|nr:preprotein translocase subunit SecE [Lachnospiraceae bacterium]